MFACAKKETVIMREELVSVQVERLVERLECVEGEETKRVTQYSTCTEYVVES